MKIDHWILLFTFAGFLALGACTPPTSLPSVEELQAADPSPRTARYLGNSGVLVRNGETKLLFDPLFDQTYNTYQQVPQTILDAVMQNRAPYDGIDAIFISHAHGDHFTARLVLQYLSAHPDVWLVAPAQAVKLLKDVGLMDETRIVSIEQQNGEPPIRIQVGDVNVEAITIPHSGGERFADVRNTVYRVQMAEDLRVLHLGDATLDVGSFAQQSNHWNRVSNDLVFTPYWLYKTPKRRVILDEYVRPKRAIGIHVPTDITRLKARYGTALDGVDMFTKPGEVRNLEE